MISPQDRQGAIVLINEAIQAGARRVRACKELDLCERTYRRWWRGGTRQSDRRPDAVRPPPANALSEAKRAQVLEIVCRPEFARLPTSQLVPALADQGRTWPANRASTVSCAPRACSITVRVRASRADANRTATRPMGPTRFGYGILPAYRGQWLAPTTTSS